MTDALAEILDGGESPPMAPDYPTWADLLPACKAPGVYFGMPEDEYHGDPSLGSGSVRALANCPVYYWRDSWMNPLRVDKRDTEALLYGRALHCLVLEGAKRFSETFATAPIKSDYPEALDTAADIKEVLRSLGQKLSGSKPDLIERLRAADPGAIFWDDIVEKFERECVDNRKTILKSDVSLRVVAAAQFILTEPRIQNCFARGTPEVSVFWVNNGVPLKARLDYVRLGAEKDHPVGLITDLKSFANRFDAEPEKAVKTAIMQHRLDVQSAQYLEGAALIPQFIRDGHVYGASKVSQQWLAEVARLQPEDWRWWWAFYEKDAPVAIPRSTRPGSAILQCARTRFLDALQSYRDYMAAFGTHWRYVDRIPDPELSAEDFPQWFGA